MGEARRQGLRRRAGADTDHVIVDDELCGCCGDGPLLGHRDAGLLLIGGLLAVRAGEHRAAVGAPDEPGSGEVTDVTSDRDLGDRELASQVADRHQSVLAEGSQDAAVTLGDQHRSSVAPTRTRIAAACDRPVIAQ